MDNLLIGIIVIVICLILAAIVALVTQKPKVKKPKCTCYFVKRDNPYCPIDGEPVPAYRRGRRLL